MVVGDFNGDTHPDVAGTDALSGRAAPRTRCPSCWATAPAGFTLRPRRSRSATAARVRAVGDLNGDGHADLGLTERPTAAPGAHFAVLYGDGAGGFGAGDGDRALLAGRRLGDGGGLQRRRQAGSRRGRGDRRRDRHPAGRRRRPLRHADHVRPRRSRPATSSPADVDGNGTVDLAVTPHGGEYVEVLLNNCGSGTSADLSTALSAPRVDQRGRRPSSTRSAVAQRRAGRGHGRGPERHAAVVQQRRDPAAGRVDRAFAGHVHGGPDQRAAAPWARLRPAANATRRGDGDLAGGRRHVQLRHGAGQRVRPGAGEQQRPPPRRR